MNDVVQALQGIINQGQGETLDVPHPVDIPNVLEVPQTLWYDSVLHEDKEKQEDGEIKSDIVKGRIVYVVQTDAYEEPIGEQKLMLQHKYVHPTRKSQDVSVTAVKPHEIRKMRARLFI